MEIKNTDIDAFPDGWFSKNLEEISGFITKGSTPTTYGFKWENSGVLFLRSECVTSNGLDLSQSMYISEKTNIVLRRSEISNNDLLITITGNVGRIVYLNENFGIANINQHIAKVRIINTDIDRKYVFHFLNQNKYRKYFDTIVTGLQNPVKLTPLFQSKQTHHFQPKQTYYFQGKLTPCS